MQLLLCEHVPVTSMRKKNDTLSVSVSVLTSQDQTGVIRLTGGVKSPALFCSEFQVRRYALVL